MWQVVGMCVVDVSTERSLPVAAGLNFNALRMQLETLLLNPGIQPNVITVSSTHLLFIFP